MRSSCRFQCGSDNLLFQLDSFPSQVDHTNSMSFPTLPVFRFPFDTKNLCGYFTAIAVEYVLINGACFFSANFFAFIIGCYQFATASIKDLKGTVRTINKNAKQNTVNRSHVLKLLSEFIEIDTNSKQLSGCEINKWLRTNRLTNLSCFICLERSKSLRKFSNPLC